MDNRAIKKASNRNDYWLSLCILGCMSGTGNGSRTRTVLLPRDFKSLVSTSSTIPACGRRRESCQTDMIAQAMVESQSHYQHGFIYSHGSSMNPGFFLFSQTNVDLASNRIGGINHHVQFVSQMIGTPPFASGQRMPFIIQHECAG